MGPGTPNSATTSLSALSVVAIKDGAAGHGGRGGNTSVGTLAAERADRISRLAGLERVSTTRAPGQTQLAPGTFPPPGYFDSTVPQIKERSTVGSASATGSVGGRTTWASGSMDYDPDKMSEDGSSSAGGLSDEGNASLVGFGEGASSTVSGPVSSNVQRGMFGRQGSAGSPIAPRSGNTFAGTAPMTGMGSGTDTRMMDDVTYDRDAMDTTMSPAPSMDQSGAYGQGTQLAESIMQDRIPNRDGENMGTPDQHHLGRFQFERD